MINGEAGMPKKTNHGTSAEAGNSKSKGGCGMRVQTCANVVPRRGPGV